MSIDVVAEITGHLHSIYDGRKITGEEMDTKWIDRCAGVFYYAFRHNLAICGNIGLALGHKNPYKVPSDIDFVTDSTDSAMRFAQRLTLCAIRYPTFIKSTISTNPRFVAPGAILHIRIESPFWLPVCVFVINGPLRIWYARIGLRVQKYDDIVSAAREIQKKDGKHRPDIEEDFAHEEPNPPAYSPEDDATTDVSDEDESDIMERTEGYFTEQSRDANDSLTPPLSG